MGGGLFCPPAAAGAPGWQCQGLSEPGGSPKLARLPCCISASGAWHVWGLARSLIAGPSGRERGALVGVSWYHSRVAPYGLWQLQSNPVGVASRPRAAPVPTEGGALHCHVGYHASSLQSECGTQGRLSSETLPTSCVPLSLAVQGPQASFYFSLMGRNPVLKNHCGQKGGRGEGGRDTRSPFGGEEEAKAGGEDEGRKLDRQNCRVGWPAADAALGCLQGGGLPLLLCSARLRKEADQLDRG